MIDLVKNYSVMGRRVKKSVIRELLSLTNRPGLISFAGGLPSGELFPAEEIKDITEKILTDNPATVLQYGSTEGYPPLKDEIVRLMNNRGYKVNTDNILITSASQQSIDMTMKLFIDASDPVFVELPSYPGGINSMAACGAHFVGVPIDDQGIKTDILEEKLKNMVREGEHYKLMYIIPDFQNPSGVTLSTERRQRLIELSKIYNFLVIEDTPYRDLRYEGDAPPALFQLTEPGNVVSLHSFSKVFVPGFRLGWICAHPDIIKKLAIMKQSVDLCTSPFTQAIAAEYLKRNLLDEHVSTILPVYKTKRDAMLKALSEHMPEGVTWTHPAGGLFLWVNLPEYMDSEEMFYEAINRKVAYVIGSAFHTDGSGKNHMRLNFSYPTPEQIEEGIKSLAELIKANMH